MNNKVICVFCGKEMEQRGQQFFGSSYSTLSYWCENCGAVANFSKGFNKKIKTVSIKYEFED
jgi:hypothetical protein